MDHYKRQEEAAARVSEMVLRPVAKRMDQIQRDVDFDPWDLFPLYGTYSSDFDECAIDVLEELQSGKKVRADLGAEMFREILCHAELCDYGTSPRGCFATQDFKAVLPAFIEKWKEFSAVIWDDE